MNLRIGVIALLSGFCGIAYEILFMRLLSNFLGEMFFVGAAVLASFLFAYGIGALHAWRLVRYLWLFEALVGAYAASLALLLFADPLQTLELLSPVAGRGVIPLTAVVFAVLMFPAAMIGFSVPMFTLYASGDSAAPSRSFARIYSFYNLGAALCVLWLEYWLLRALGIRFTILMLAAVNLGIGWLVWRLPQPPSAAKSAGTAVPLRAGIALSLTSLASGIWQLLLLKFAEQTFGPFHENFSLVVALGLLGICVGAFGATRIRASASWWMIGCAFSMILSFGLVNQTLVSWAWLNQEFGEIPALAPVIKLTVLAMLGGVPLAAFGAAIPIVLKTLSKDSAPSVGRLMAVSSFANVAGYLAMVFVIYENMDYHHAVLVAATLAALAGSMLCTRGRRLAPFAASVVAIALLAAWLPTRSYLDYGYDHLRSLRQLKTLESQLAGVETVKKFDNRVDILRTRSGAELVNINGYYSLATVEGGRPNFHEVVFGLVPALYVSDASDALVLGLGTGITAGATASVFRRTTAVEINPALYSLMPRFARENMDIARNPHAELLLKDALTYLAETDRRFDAIVNTVTSPLYFSSSKLYTREFFRLAASRLKPDGVYALWFDNRVTEAGARILFQTLKESFADCHLVYISSGYMQVVCAQHVLVPRRLPPGRLGTRLTAIIRAEAPATDPGEFLLSLVFPRNGIHTRSWDTAPNTMERPTLEFLMSSLALNQREQSRFLGLAEVDLRYSGLKVAQLDGPELAMRCYALRVMAFSAECLQAMRAQFHDRLPRWYLMRVLELIERSPDPAADRDEALALVEQLVIEGRLSDAPYIEGWLRRLNPTVLASSDDMRYRYLASLLLVKFRLLTRMPVSDELVIELARISPIAPETLEVLAYVAAQRKDAAAGSFRVDLLGRMGTPVREVEAMRARLRLISGSR